MLSRFAKLLLTSTAIAPVLLTYAWVALMAGEARLATILTGRMHRPHCGVPWFASVRQREP
jgi:hypothetical protein